jgi:probable HAF family extracellular repeat protein
MQALGTLGGYSDTTATALNNSGQIVGYAGIADPYYEISQSRAFAFTSGRIQAIAPRGSVATGINDSGKIVGSDVVAGQTRPFVVDSAGAARTNLYTPITIDNDDGETLLPIPHAINNAGVIAGETIYADSGNQLAWVFTPGSGSAGLRVVAGETNSAALAINNSGVSTGYSGSVIGARAFRNNGGDPIDLGMLPEAMIWASSRGLGINDANQIVGDSSANFEGSITHAVMFANGQVYDLGTLPGQTDSSAADINNQGIIVGTSGGHAFVFRDGKMTDLNTLIPKVNGLVLTSAVAINDKGQIAVNGVVNGHSRAFLLKLNDTATIGGSVFLDVNGDGVRQVAESLIRSRRVYVDSNRNGKYDPGEQMTFTSPAGHYRLDGLATGSVRVGLEAVSGWQSTTVVQATTSSATTRSIAKDVLVKLPSAIDGIDFGSKRR